MDDLAQRIRDRIAKIPATNPSYIAAHQETLGQILSPTMLWLIANEAALEAKGE